MRDQNHIVYQSNSCHEQIRIFYELTNRSQIRIDLCRSVQSRLIEHDNALCLRQPLENRQLTQPLARSLFSLTVHSL